jgi:hypothetical protein
MQIIVEFIIYLIINVPGFGFWLVVFGWWDLGRGFLLAFFILYLYFNLAIKGH